MWGSGGGGGGSVLWGTYSLLLHRNITLVNESPTADSGTLMSYFGSTSFDSQLVTGETVASLW